MTVEKVERTRVVEVLIALRKPASGGGGGVTACSGWPRSACWPPCSSRPPRWRSSPPTGCGCATWPRRAPRRRPLPGGLPPPRARALHGHDGRHGRPHRGRLGADLRAAAHASAAWPRSWSTVVLTPVMLVFGEIIPKAVAREWATSLILRLYRPAHLGRPGCWRRSWPWPTRWSARCCARSARPPGATPAQFVSREELKALLQMEPGEADVTTQEAEMIDKIFDLGDTTRARGHGAAGGRGRCCPRPPPPPTPSPPSSSAASRACPIYSERETNVVGVVTAMDLLRRGGQVRGRDRADAASRPSCPRPSASTTCCARCRRAACSWPSWSTSTAAPPGS